MPLDRAWYNTLQDDSGAGLDGTVWNKAAVAALMLTIDARVQDWIPVPFNAAKFAGNGSIWTVEAADVVKNRYCRIGNLLVWNVAIAASSMSGTGNPLLVLTAPAGLTFPNSFNYAQCILPTQARVQPGVDGAPYLVADYQVGNWPAVTNGLYLYFTWIGEVA